MRRLVSAFTLGVFVLFTCVFLVSMTLNTAYAAKKLEMIWSFDEGTGDVAKEANGTGNDGKNSRFLEFYVLAKQWTAC